MKNNKEEFIRDMWYEKLGKRVSVEPEEEPVVGLMEWVDIMCDNKL